MEMKCLVICPFGQPDSETRKRSDAVFAEVIMPITDAEGYKAYRSIDFQMPGNITSQVIRDLYEADLVIADLTDSNPNVFYELALRHSVEKPFILISDDVSKIPFDLTTLNVIQVDRVLTFSRGVEVQNEIRRQIQQIKRGEAHFETDASRLHPGRGVQRLLSETSVKVYRWNIIYTNSLAKDWLTLQEEGLRKCVENFLKEEEAPCEPLYRSGVAEYMAYSMTQGLDLLGELYYLVNNENNTLFGWGNFFLPGSTDPLAIRISGEERKEDNTEKVIINFSQPSRKISLTIGIQVEIRAFNYKITFENHPSRPKIYSGKLFHPEFNSVLVGESKLTLSYRSL